MVLAVRKETRCNESVCGKNISTATHLLPFVIYASSLHLLLPQLNSQPERGTDKKEKEENRNNTDELPQDPFIIKFMLFISFSLRICIAQLCSSAMG